MLSVGPSHIPSRHRYLPLQFPKIKKHIKSKLTEKRNNFSYIGLRGYKMDLTVSETLGPFLSIEIQGPMAPESFNSLDVCNKGKNTTFKINIYTPYSKMAANKLFFCLRVD